MISQPGDLSTSFELDLLKRIVQLALDEDKVTNDVTTGSLLKFDRLASAQVLVKQDGIISGISAFRKTFQMVDPEITIRIIKADGSSVKTGEVVASVKGRESSILKAERTALNFLQRLSGIATTTARFVEIAKSTHVSILDTRKTTPGMRYLEKRAVRDGGAMNHRMNLEAMALVKDNHIKMAGSITQAVKNIQAKFARKKIEVEVKNLTEFKEAMSLDVDCIMLDNFNAAMIGEATNLNEKKIKLEVSGNVTLDNLESKIQSGIDFISIGALTHSFKSLDLSLEIV
jgi:nicotinate-nucleotide pyrophosphorylase (carboxylating)